MGLSIIVVIAVNVVILVILLTIFLHFYNAAYECDVYPSFWCHTDWRCPGFSYDDDKNKVMKDRFGRGITNANVKGYLLATTGNLDNEQTYKYGVEGDATRPFIKNRPSTEDGANGPGGSCGGTYEQDGITYTSSCNKDGQPLQLPEVVDENTDIYGCYCGGPVEESGAIRGYCRKGAGYNLCSILGNQVDGECDNSATCQPLMSKLCNPSSFSSLVKSCVDPPP
jgi:hypothetical protein